MSILESIVASRRLGVGQLPLERKVYECSPNFSRKRLSLRQALQRSDTGIIAEFKRRSPSLGVLKNHANCRDMVASYQSAGATGVSVLTEPDYFSGSDDDLREARAVLESTPLLMKDFFLSERQLLQARANGADCVLLIARILAPQDLRRLALFAKSLELEVILEVHNSDELERALCPEVDIVGVNNRNLGTLDVDIARSFELIDQIPREFLPISESGIRTPAEISSLRRAGFRGFLVGTALMSQSTQIEELLACS